MPTPFIHVDVYLLLRRGSEVLLGKRIGARYGSGEYMTPAGKMEPGESMIDCLIRESREEVGIVVSPEAVRLCHVLHFHEGSDRIGLFFEVWQWSGEVVNAEPEKCEGWEWFPVDALPCGLMDYVREPMRLALSGEPQSLWGW